MSIFKYLAPVMIVVVFIFYSMTNWTNENINESIVYGEKIVSALESYKEAEGGYPSKLLNLVPLYLIELPLPKVGIKNWDYLIEGLYRTHMSNEWFMDSR